mmetsp:Transcript_22517/g.68638  ORF Transcript_22517/g.68638 Transcript_22517/m.68638 type:complete len:95 (+) Transcript_22517:556-840(+)
MRSAIQSRKCSSRLHDGLPMPAATCSATGGDDLLQRDVGHLVPIVLIVSIVLMSFCNKCAHVLASIMMSKPPESGVQRAWRDLEALFCWDLAPV